MSYKISKIDQEYRNFVIDKGKKYQAREDAFNIFLKDERASKNFENKKGTKNVLILGDSKSEDLYASLMLTRELYPEYEFRRVRLDNRCMNNFTELSLLENFSIECQKEINFLFNSSLIINADIILLSNTWEIFNNSNVYNFIISLSELDKSILVLSTANFNDLTSLSLVIAKNQIPHDDQSKFFYNNIRLDWRKASMDLKRQISSIPNTIYLDKLEVFCNLDKEECDLFSKDGKPYIFDSGHVTVEGALLFGEKISELDWLN